MRRAVTFSLECGRGRGAYVCALHLPQACHCGHRLLISKHQCWLTLPKRLQTSGSHGFTCC